MSSVFGAKTDVTGLIGTMHCMQAANEVVPSLQLQKSIYNYKERNQSHCHRTRPIKVAMFQARILCLINTVVEARPRCRRFLEHLKCVQDPICPQHRQPLTLLVPIWFWHDWWTR